MKLRDCFLFFFLTVLLIAGTSCEEEAAAGDGLVTDTVIVEEPDTLVEFTLAVVGDLMCHDPQFKYAKVGSDSFNFVPCYEEVGRVLEEADFTFGNLETTLTGADARYSGYPQFNTPDDYVSALKHWGFDLLSTSNNHSLDRHWKGVKRTIEVLNQHEIGYVGTYLSPEDRDSVRVFDIKGIKVAFLAYTYGTNGIEKPAGKPWSVNLIEPDSIRKDVRAARMAEADLVLVYLHYGAEYVRSPGADQRKAVQTAWEAGADLVIGGHPHVLQPVEFVETKDARMCEGFVAWSMGNFISNQSKPNTRDGMILRLRIAHHLVRDSFYVAAAEYLPTWVYRGGKLKRLHVVLPAALGKDTVPYKYLAKAEMSAMRESFIKTNKLISSMSNRARVLPDSAWRLPVAVVDSAVVDSTGNEISQEKMKGASE